MPTTTPTETRGPSAHIVAPVPMSYEEFLTWDHEGGLAEWVSGEAWVYMSATELHQRVVEFLLTLLRIFVEEHDLGRVVGASFAMRALPGGPGREPDVMFVSREHLERFGRTQLNGPADIAIEVISDDSVSRDRDEKFFEYQRGGVREYWIVDPRPDRLRADFYVLDAVGQYRPVPLGSDGRYHSTIVPGFWLKVAWFWTEPPRILAAFQEIIGARGNEGTAGSRPTPAT